MERQVNYILSQTPLEIKNYLSINQHFNADSQLFQNWIQQTLRIYSLNDNAQAYKPKMNHIENQAYFQQLNELMSAFISSQRMINKNHSQYLQGIQNKFMMNKLMYYTDMAIKIAEKIKTKKSELKNCKKKFQKIESKVLNYNKIQMASFNQPQEYFNTASWQENKQNLKIYADIIEKNASQFIEDKQQLQTLSQQFQTFLFSYRKKLLKYRVQFLKQSAKVSRSFFQCISELISLGYNQIKTIAYTVKNKNLRNSGSIRSSYQNNHVQALQQQSKLLANYRYILASIRQLYILPQISSPAKLPSKRVKNMQQDRFKQFYQNNGHIYEQISRVEQICHLFQELREQIVEQATKIINVFSKKQQQNMRQIDILQTIQGQKKLKKKKSLKQSSYFLHDKDINYLDESTYAVNAENNITQFLQFIVKEYDMMSKKCFKLFENSTYKKSHHHSLMEITNQFKQILINQIKPNPQELWLYKDWRDTSFLQSVQITSKMPIDQIKAKIAKIDQIFNEETTDKKYECALTLQKKYKILLLLLPKALQLLSYKKNIDYIIPKESIVLIEKLKQKIIIKTNNGAKFKIGNFKDITAEDIENIIKQQLQQTSDTNLKVKIKEKIKLTEQQQNALKNRKKNIENQLPKIQQFTVYAQKTLTTDIQTLYELIFSDNGQYLPQPSFKSFFQYLNIKKFKNFNYSISNYDKPGPAFYTGDQQSGITFLNCPLYSTRQSQMDHPLPPIPFIPKQCHCKTTQKLFWISDQQLYQLTQTRQSQPPMMTAVIVYQLTTIKKIDDKLRLQIMGKFDFIKQTRMKSIIKNGGEGQMKDLCPKILNQMESSIKAYNRIISRGSTGSNGNKIQNNQEEQQQNSAISQKVKSSNKNTQYLIGFAIITILLNIIVHFLMK